MPVPKPKEAPPVPRSKVLREERDKRRFSLVMTRLRLECEMQMHQADIALANRMAAWASAEPAPALRRQATSTAR